MVGAMGGWADEDEDDGWKGELGIMKVMGEPGMMRKMGNDGNEDWLEEFKNGVYDFGDDV